MYDSDSQIRVRYSNTAAAAEQSINSDVTNVSPITFANNDYIIVKTDFLPIQGWSSNAVSSEDYGSRDVIVEGAGNAGSAITANVTNIDFTETRDTASAWDGTQFKATETGNYSLSGCLQVTSSITTTSIVVYVNGISNKVCGRSENAVVFPFAATVYLKKDDVMSIRISDSATLVDIAVNHWIHIQKNASSQSIWETETVAARYTSDSGQSIPNAVDTIVIFEDVDEDSHAIYDPLTGVGTAKNGGLYDFHSFILYNTISFADDERIELNLNVNGSLFCRMFRMQANGSTSSFESADGVAKSVRLNKGDTFSISTFQNRGGAQSLNTNPVNNYFSIARIGD